MQAQLFEVYVILFGSEWLFSYRYASGKYVVFSRTSSPETRYELKALYGAVSISPALHYQYWEESNALR